MREALSIVVRSDPGISPEQARDARVRGWAFVFDCYAKKKGGPATAPNDAKERFNDLRARLIISEPS